MASMIRTLRLACTTFARVPTRSLSVTTALQSDIKLKDDSTKLQPTIEADPLTDVSVLTGVPEEQVKTRHARIYVPAKNAMQSGTSKTKKWHLEFDTQERWENPLMGWSSTGDPLSNMDLTFTSPDDAMAYCEKNGWDYHVDDKKSMKLRPKSYGQNFSWNKRTRVSTK